VDQYTKGDIFKVTNHITTGLKSVVQVFDAHGSGTSSQRRSGRAFCHVLLATVDETPQPAVSLDSTGSFLNLLSSSQSRFVRQSP